MKAVWSVADCIVSPLGFTTEANYASLLAGIAGVQQIVDSDLYPEGVLCAAKVNTPDAGEETRFEWMCSQAIEGVLSTVHWPLHRTLFVLSTTKGNIELLDRGMGDHPRLALHATARYLAAKFGIPAYQVVSNACISGVLALLVAKRFIQAGVYDHALIVGADVLSHFVVSGFHSLQAMSTAPCKPFDKNRAGINLGEAAAAMVLSADPPALKTRARIQLLGGSTSNDANHISGPSRTGQELSLAIAQALHASALGPEAIDFVSAHGTATIYNDEMEAKAFSLSGLGNVPLNSLKGYYGHTLGAAGVLETIVASHALQHNQHIPTKGFEALGVSKDINVCHKSVPAPLKHILKTASGFGGCNAALVLQKEDQ